MVTAETAVAHLYRRAGFGAHAEEVATAASAGYSATVDAWVAGLGAPEPAAGPLAPPKLVPVPLSFATFPPKSAALRALLDDARRQLPALVQWWMARMVAATNPLTEKLTFLLHCQFPTAVSKVRFPSLMLAQNELFRRQGAGAFDALTLAVAQDPAMLIWLDAGTDNKGHPNENFARELLERFTMGTGTFSQADVVAAAVCFTGWRFHVATGSLGIDPRDHDSTPQTFLGQTGVNTGAQVIDIATHTAASAAWVASRMWSFLAYPVSPSDPVVADIAPSYAGDLHIGNLVRAVLTHPSFTSTTALTGLVKQPVEWVAGTLRALRFSPAAVAAGDPAVYGVLAALGQIPFDPPSVGGWPANNGWLSTAAALARWQWAQHVTTLTGADLSAVVDAAPSARLDALSALLGVDSWSRVTAAALARRAGDPTSMVALALVSPEYVLN